MAVIRITKEFTFEMAHALAGYDGMCREIHGHSYRLLVTVSGTPNNDPADPKYGMVMDFGELKELVKKRVVDVYDHALVMRRTEDNGRLTDVLREEFGNVRIVDFQPTSENLLLDFAKAISEGLPPGVRLFSMKLHETATSYAEWFAEDNGLKG